MRWASQATQDVWHATNTKAAPVPFDKLGSIITPRGGNCGIVIAAPGQGKTTFLLNWMVKGDVRALYMSADTSPHDLTAQLGALATGETRDKVERRLGESLTWRQEYGKHISTKFPNLVLDFSSQPRMEQIEARVGALTELWGRTPEIVVMDTASNVFMEDMGSNAEWQTVWLKAIEIARTFNLFFMFAHHVKVGPARGGRVAPEMNDGLWGSDQFAELVMGLHTPRPKELTLTVRKNRTGAKDVPVRFVTDFAKADVREKD